MITSHDVEILKRNSAELASLSYSQLHFSFDPVLFYPHSMVVGRSVFFSLLAEY